MVTCIRFPDGVSDELSTDYDLLLLSQAVTYNDGSSGAATYCSPAAGQLPAKLHLYSTQSASMIQDIFLFFFRPTYRHHCSLDRSKEMNVNAK